MSERLKPLSDNEGIIYEFNQLSWQDQIQRFVNMGYASDLGISEDEYRASLPSFADQPEQFRGHFDRALLVDPRVSLSIQLKDYVMPKQLRQKLAMYQPVLPAVADSAYQLWVQDGEAYQRVSIPEFNRKKLDFERGLTIAEGSALVREMPSVLQHGIALTGTRFQDPEWHHNGYLTPIFRVQGGRPTVLEQLDSLWPLRRAQIPTAGDISLVK